MKNQIKSNPTTKEKKQETIDVAEHPSFNGDIKTEITNTMALSQLINSLFDPAYQDFCGCKIRINSQGIIPGVLPGDLYVDLYFKYNTYEVKDAKGWKNLKSNFPDPNAPKEKVGLSDRYASVVPTAAQANKKYRAFSFTKETFNSLEEFMPNGSNTNWNYYVDEETYQVNPYGKDGVYSVIRGLSLSKIITKIYGAKTEEGRFEYNASVSTFIPSKAGEFIIQIAQLDLRTVRELQDILGINVVNTTNFHPSDNFNSFSSRKY